MSEGIDRSALQHATNRLRSAGGVIVLFDGTMCRCSSFHRHSLGFNRILDEKFDPHRCEARRRWPARAVFGGMIGEEEWRAVDGQSCDNIGTLPEFPSS